MSVVSARVRADESDLITPEGATAGGRAAREPDVISTAVRVISTAVRVVATAVKTAVAVARVVAGAAVGRSTTIALPWVTRAREPYASLIRRNVTGSPAVQVAQTRRVRRRWHRWPADNEECAVPQAAESGRVGACGLLDQLLRAELFT